MQRSVENAAGIVHPNVAAVHGMERDGRGAFVVVEPVDGSSLRDMLADRGPLPAAGAAGRQATTTAAPAGPDPRVVPSVVGLHREQAADVLTQAQLEVQVLRVPVQESGQVTLLVGSKRPTG